MLGRYTRTFALVMRNILSAAVPIAAVLALNVAFSYVTQGDEIAATARESAASFAVLKLIAAAAYGAISLWVAVAMTLLARRKRLFHLNNSPSLPEEQATIETVLPLIIAVCALLPSARIMFYSVIPFQLFAAIGCLTLLFLPVLAVLTSTGRLKLPKLLERCRSSRAVGIAVVVTLSAGTIAAILFVASPVTLARAAGPWALVYIAVGIWTLLWSILFVVLPYMCGLPSFAILPLLTAVVFSRFNDNHVVRQLPIPRDSSLIDTVPNTAQSYGEFARHTKRWLQKHCTRGVDATSLPCPVIFVAAEGGGLRAAYWTNVVLSELDKKSNRHFRDHLFAISGVSGGSLGSAAYFLGGLLQQQKQTERGEVRMFLQHDYLSPILDGLLFGDFIQNFVPWPVSSLDRAKAFETAFESSWASDTASRMFAQPMLQTLAAISARDELPLLFFNSTNVESGKRYVISTLNLPVNKRGDEYFAFDRGRLGSVGDLRWSTGVSLSARFPIVAPPALILSPPTDLARATWPTTGSKMPPTEVMWGRLVDGGYFENSGSATLSDVVKAFQDVVSYMHIGPDPNEASHSDLWLGAYIKPEIVILIISNDPQPLQYVSSTTVQPPSPPERPAEPPKEVLRAYMSRIARDRVFSDTNIWTTSPALSEVLSPLYALLNSRVARATTEKSTLAQLLKQIQEDQIGSCAKAIYKAPPEAVANGKELEWLILQHKLDELGVSDKQERLKACTPLLSYQEVSLASAISADDASLDISEDDRAYRELIRDLQGPGLGWTLSKSSFERMDKLSSTIIENPYVYGFGTESRIEGSRVLISLQRYYKEGVFAKP